MSNPCLPIPRADDVSANWLLRQPECRFEVLRRCTPKVCGFSMMLKPSQMGQTLEKQSSCHEGWFIFAAAICSHLRKLSWKEISYAHLRLHEKDTFGINETRKDQVLVAPLHFQSREHVVWFNNCSLAAQERRLFRSVERASHKISVVFEFFAGQDLPISLCMSPPWSALHPDVATSNNVTQVQP